LKRYGRNGNQREDVSPLLRFLATTPCSNYASHLHLHLQFTTHLPLQPQKRENHHEWRRRPKEE